MPPPLPDLRISRMWWPLWPLTSWPQNLSRSSSPSMHACTYFEVVPSIGAEVIMKRKISYFTVRNDLCDLWPLTPKSNLFMVPQVSTYIPGLKLIHQSVLKLSWERTNFKYAMTSVNFDPWPHDPKFSSDLCPPSMHACTKFELDPLPGSQFIMKISYFTVRIDLCDLWPLTSWSQNLIRSWSP